MLNAPNLALFGHDDMRNLLEEIKLETNNEEFDISFKNKEGKLKIMRDVLGNWIDYIVEVGGRYLLKFTSNGITETKTSDTDIAKTYLVRKKTEKFSDDELNNIQTKMNAINKLESRDEEG